MSLSIELKTIDNISVFELKGKIISDNDISEANELLSKLKVWNIVFDLSGLTHTNSSGIGFMVKAMTRSRIQNGDVVLLNPNAGLAKLFEITKMHEVFTICETFEEAKNHFNK